MPNFIAIFITGLLTGGITCTAVQGGLLVAIMANQKNPTNLTNQTNEKRLRMLSIILLFVGAKLVSHTVLGFLLGLLGETMHFSVQLTSGMLILASLFMIGLALNMLSVHPFFRHFSITTPKFFRTILWNQSKRAGFFSPIILGALTIFIPCGVTQAMMAQAIGYGNPTTGALILFFFILGTTPLFILLGLVLTTLSKRFGQWFITITAVLIIAMAFWNIYNTSTMFGFDRVVGRAMKPVLCQIVYCEDSLSIDSGNQRQITHTPVISIRQSSYDIDNPYIKAGDTITLTVKNIDGAGCIQYFTIPSLNIQKFVPAGKQETIVFTAPKEAGELPFMCSMGMYRGKFIVQ